MPRGGLREGAGRKKGIGNLLTRELREEINAVKLIHFLQDVADGKVEGASIGERKDAAVALLKKVLPDINRHEAEVETTYFEPLRISREMNHMGLSQTNFDPPPRDCRKLD